MEKQHLALFYNDTDSNCDDNNSSIDDSSLNLLQQLMKMNVN